MVLNCQYSVHMAVGSSSSVLPALLEGDLLCIGLPNDGVDLSVTDALLPNSTSLMLNA